MRTPTCANAKLITAGSCGLATRLPAMIRSWLREPVLAALVEKPRGEWLHSDSAAEKGLRADRPEELRMSHVWSLQEVGTMERSSLASRRNSLSEQPAV